MLWPLQNTAWTTTSRWFLGMIIAFTVVCLVGSATITATAARMRPQATQVLVARAARGIVVVPAQDIMAVAIGQVVLRRTPQKAAISVGNVLVSNGGSGGGLLARWCRSGLAARPSTPHHSHQPGCPRSFGMTM